MAFDAADEGLASFCLFCAAPTEALYCSQACKDSDAQDAYPADGSPPPLVPSSVSSPDSSPHVDPARHPVSLIPYRTPDTKASDAYLKKPFSLPPSVVPPESAHLFRFRSPLLSSYSRKHTPSEPTPSIKSPPPSAYSSPVLLPQDPSSTSPPLSQLSSSSVPTLNDRTASKTADRASSASAAFLFSAVNGRNEDSTHSSSIGHPRRSSEGAGKIPGHSGYSMLDRRPTVKPNTAQVKKIRSQSFNSAYDRPTLPSGSKTFSRMSSDVKMNHPHGFLFGRSSASGRSPDDEGFSDESTDFSSLSPQSGLRVEEKEAFSAKNSDSPLTTALYSNRFARPSLSKLEGTCQVSQADSASRSRSRGRGKARPSLDQTVPGDHDENGAPRGRSRVRGQAWAKRSRSRPRAIHRQSNNTESSTDAGSERNSDHDDDLSSSASIPSISDVHISENLSRPLRF